MAFSPLVDELMARLRVLPGVGAKTAQRMAFHLLERDREGALKLAQTLNDAMEAVGHCRDCRTLTELDVCAICENPRRETGHLCVVESPADMLAIENSGSYSGRYFVLHGQISPLDGLGPEDVGIPQLLARLEAGDVEELVIATGSRVEGEATAHYIAEQARVLAQAHHLSLRLTRIAQGVPLNGELEYVDGGTLMHAFAGRTPL